MMGEGTANDAKRRVGFYALDVLLIPLRLVLWPFARLSEWMDRSVNPWIRRGARKGEQ